MESSMFFIMQQQMKQMEDKNISREQQMLIAQMEHKAMEREHKECQIQRERHHQDFMMMMMMMMVTGAKSPAPPPPTPYYGFVTSAKLSLNSPTSATPDSTITTVSTAFAEEGKLKNAEETTLHDTVMHMKTPPLPNSTMSDS
eukprot:12543759-Ditylum_brightwellii.AAC.1